MTERDLIKPAGSGREPGNTQVQHGPSHVDDAAPRWTPEAIARLRELAAAEVAAEVIAQAMHRPMTEIVGKAAELGLMLRPENRAH